MLKLCVQLQIQKDKINTLVIVPLYPQYSISTSGSSLKLLEEIFYKDSSIWGPHAGACDSLDTKPYVHKIIQMFRAQGEPYRGSIVVLPTGLRPGNGQAHTAAAFGVFDRGNERRLLDYYVCL